LRRDLDRKMRARGPMKSVNELNSFPPSFQRTVVKKHARGSAGR
jgi:hypothetical protein